jgi:hypothetical protein
MRLAEVKRTIPYSFTYNGMNFHQIFYSSSSWKTRSIEIIWENKQKTGQVYLLNDEIEFISYDT